MTTKDCPHMSGCEMYSLLRLSGTVKAWQARYCQHEYSQCARHKLSAEGRSVPVNLMPSGALLKAAGTT